MGQSRPKLTVFIDSSVLFTAVNSLTGGSAQLFIQPQLSLVTSPIVLTETERNIRAKLYPHHLHRFLKLVSLLTISKTSKSNYLVTLDKKHFFTPKVRHFLKPQQVVTPKDLLTHN